MRQGKREGEGDASGKEGRGNRENGSMERVKVSTESFSSICDLVSGRKNDTQRTATAAFSNQRGEEKRKKKRKLTDISRIISSAKDQFGSSIISRADIRDIWFTRDQDLSRSEIAQLEYASVWIE